jgi:hypothetical protein
MWFGLGLPTLSTPLSIVFMTALKRLVFSDKEEEEKKKKKRSS